MSTLAALWNHLGFLFVWLFFSFFFFFFIAPPTAYEVPKLRIESELQQPAYATATAMPILDESATSSTAHGTAGSLTH